MQSLCTRVYGTLGNNSFSNLKNSDRLAYLVILGLVEWSESSALALLPQIAQKFFILDFILETQLLTHCFVFREKELISRNLFISFLKPEFQSSEIRHCFSSQLLQIFLLGLSLFFTLFSCSLSVTLFVSVIFLNQTIIILDFQTQKPFLLSFKYLIRFFVIKELLVRN